MPRKGQPMSQATKDKLRRLAADRRKGGSSTGDNLAAAPLAELEDDIVEDTDFELDIQIPDVLAPPISLKDRLLKKLSNPSNPSQAKAAPKKKAARSKQDDKELLFSFLPIIAGALSMYASSMWDEEYKECAPTKQETSAILAPIFRIIARRVEISGKIGDDALDVLTCLLAGITYGTRVLIVHGEIKKGKQQDESNISDIRDYTSRRRSSQEPANRTFRADDAIISFVERRDELNRENVHGFGVVDSDNEPTPHETSISALLAKARAKDFDYRSRNGLL